MTRHYYKSDVLQALTAALLFHEDIALAARDERGGQLHPGAGNTVLMSDQAADLLREAWAILEGSDQGAALRVWRSVAIFPPTCKTRATDTPATTCGPRFLTDGPRRNGPGTRFIPAATAGRLRTTKPRTEGVDHGQGKTA